MADATSPDSAQGRFNSAIASVALAACAAWATPGLAEIYVFDDASGDRHVSTLPPEAIGRDGKLRSEFDPNNLGYQQRALAEKLANERAELDTVARREAAASPSESSRTAAAGTGSVGTTKEGLMGLEELIELSRRGGRWTPTTADASSDGDRDQ